MVSGKRRIAVIGAGVCGLCSVKCLKEEGLDAVCFEMTDHYGGTWRYHEEDIDGLASVMWTTIANNSKEMSAISDFPPPKEAPNFLSHRMIYDLVQQYAERFNLIKLIKFKHEVTYVDMASDYKETGRWDITYKDIQNDIVRTETFDGVMVCTGQFSYANMPQYSGQEKFKGEILHSKALKKFDRFEGQRILVVGIGCSGVDAATESSNFASQVYLSTRRGGWVFPRLGPYGLPFDSCYLRRWSDVIFRCFPYSFTSWYFERILEHLKFSHALFGLKPQHLVWCQDPVFSDQLPLKIATGEVLIRNNIKLFTENGVIFEGENKVTEVDSVIMATGYRWKFPYLAKGIITKDGDCLNLYKCIYPPQLKHPTLAIMGFMLPLGPGFPMGELQCRWASLLMNRKLSLPSEQEMIKDIRKIFQKNSRRYRITDRLTTRVDYVEYVDDIASQFGAKPNLLKLLFTDPKLFYALAFGPCLPYQYRLQGPHAWSGAREAILTFKERIKAPLKTNVRGNKEKRLQGFPVKLILAFLVFLFWINVVTEI